MSLNNLWHVLDIAVRNRVYCAHWTELNDPLEGHYELYFRGKDDSGRTQLESALKANRDRHRIASFSEDHSNILLWSHYADGHKGVALEVEIDTEDPTLTQIVYSDFYSVFSEDADVTMNHPHVFNGKTPEWAYEKEWRIITTYEYFTLDTPCSRILLGPLIPMDRRMTLERILPDRVKLIETSISYSTGKVEIVAPESSAQRASPRSLVLEDNRPTGNVMDKYALLVRMNPKDWPTWERHMQPGKDSHAWFKVGRRIPEEIHAGLPVVVLGTSGMGILATGETASAAEFRADPDWAEAAPSDQAECKEPQHRVKIRIQGLATPVPVEEIKADPTVARLLKAARETITWLKSDEHTVLMSLVRGQNG